MRRGKREMKCGAGKVYLVGAGPGDLELMTLKGRRLIGEADALVYDHLVNPEMLSWVKAGCEPYDVGKRAGAHPVAQEAIFALLIELAGRGLQVVRLKGGDPLIFGRGGEEAQQLRRHGIGYEVVPAVTAALGCAAYAGIPLTHREHSRAVSFISGHGCADGEAGSGVDWEAYGSSGATLALYMAMAHLEVICARLIAGGRAPDTACCVIQWGTLPRQKLLYAPLVELAARVAEAELSAPAMVFIGDVVALGAELAWYHPAEGNG